MDVVRWTLVGGRCQVDVQVDKSNKIRLSAAAIGANAVKNVLEISSKHSATERRRWVDMDTTESVPCFEDDGRTRKRSRSITEIMIVAELQLYPNPRAPM